MAEDKLAPAFLSKRTAKLQVPWAATIFTMLFSMLIIVNGAPIWLFAATNFEYLMVISASSIASFIVVKELLKKESVKGAGVVKSLSLLGAAAWLSTIMFGFQ